MHFPRIEYLRWVRTQRTRDQKTVSLALSGIELPRPEMFQGLQSAALLNYDSGDRPPLARQIGADLGVGEDRVILQPGTHWTLLHLLAARLSLRPGPVIVEQPCYEPLRAIAATLAGEPLRLLRDSESETGFEAEALNALEAESPSVLLLSQPHNPSGVQLNAGQLRALASWADARDCAILSDEVYVDFLPDPEAGSMLAYSEQAVSLRSFTKVMGLNGLRCSYAMGPAAWIARAAEISDYGPQAVSAPSQAMAACAWEQRGELFARARRIARDGRAIVTAAFDGNEDLVDASLPDAGIICFPRLSPDAHAAALRHADTLGPAAEFGFGLDAYPEGSHRWIAALQRSEHVELVPGAFFEDPLAFRLGFGATPPVLEEGLNRLMRFLRSALEER